MVNSPALTCPKKTTARGEGMSQVDLDEFEKSLAIGGGVLEALLTRPEIRTRLWN